MNKLLPTFIALILFASCSSNETKFTEDDGLAVFNEDSLKKHIVVLASDDFMGRKPFTEGETKTVAYLQEQFKQMGLEPGNGDSYIQEVPMANILATAAPSMQVKSAKGSFNLKAFDDYIIWTDKTDSSISLDNAELVFAGYGVVAPEYNWNDYAGLDVKGKVVMVMVNDPGFWVGDTTLFKGKAMTYYGRWTYKFEEAARQGAKGCLIIHNTAAAGYDSSLLIKANQPGFKAVPLGLQLSTTMKVKASFNKSSNVIAKITGTKRPDEVIIYTAHWDHLGIGRPDQTGDSIYNGALDNASGTAGLLEMARVFKNMKAKPERTIVFLAVTAEEQGLLGSAYYAENPIYPVNKTVANINMDGLNRFGKTNDMVVVGQGQSELEDYLKEAIEKTGGYLSFDTHTEAGYYYRSDHFNFAKVGIPALFANNGVDVVGKGKEYGETLENEYSSKNYHQPSDNYDATTWTGDGAINDLKLLFTIGRRMGFETSFPKWKEGSEFKLIREKSNK